MNVVDLCEHLNQKAITYGEGTVNTNSVLPLSRTLLAQKHEQTDTDPSSGPLPINDVQHVVEDLLDSLWREVSNSFQHHNSFATVQEHQIPVLQCSSGTEVAHSFTYHANEPSHELRLTCHPCPIEDEHILPSSAAAPCSAISPEISVAATSFMSGTDRSRASVLDAFHRARATQMHEVEVCFNELLVHVVNSLRIPTDSETRKCPIHGDCADNPAEPFPSGTLPAAPSDMSDSCSVTQVYHTKVVRKNDRSVLPNIMQNYRNPSPQNRGITELENRSPSLLHDSFWTGKMEENYSCTSSTLNSSSEEVTFNDADVDSSIAQILSTPSRIKQRDKFVREMNKLKSPYACPSLKRIPAKLDLECENSAKKDNQRESLCTPAVADSLSILVLKRPFKKHILTPHVKTCSAGTTDLQGIMQENSYNDEKFGGLGSMEEPTSTCESVFNHNTGNDHEVIVDSCRRYSDRTSRKHTIDTPAASFIPTPQKHQESDTQILPSQDVCRSTETRVSLSSPYYSKRARRKIVHIPSSSVEQPNSFLAVKQGYKPSISVDAGVDLAENSADPKQPILSSNPVDAEKLQADARPDTERVDTDWETANGRKLQMTRDPALAAEWAAVVVPKLPASASTGDPVEHTSLGSTMMRRRSPLHQRFKQDPLVKKLVDEHMNLEKLQKRLQEAVKLSESALSCETRSEKARLESLIEKWRKAAQTACDDIFFWTETQVHQAGGLREWKKMQTHQSWFDSSQSKTQYDTETEEYELTAEEKDAMGISDDIFTMKHLLDSLGIPVKLIGWDSDMCCWI